jgi:hypothetical protein
MVGGSVEVIVVTSNIPNILALLSTLDNKIKESHSDRVQHSPNSRQEMYDSHRNY